MVIAMTTSEIASQFLELFRKPERWCRLPTAIDRDGGTVVHDDSLACAWCLFGAYLRASQTEAIRGDLDRFWNELYDVSESMYHKDPIGVNDEIGLPAVRAILRRVRDRK